MSSRCCTMMGARPSDGSSIRISSGSIMSARAIASICRSPPESWRARWFLRSASRGNNAKMRSTVHPVVARALLSMVMCSVTVSDPNRRRPCGTMAMRCAATAWGRRPISVSPRQLISPLRTCGGVQPHDRADERRLAHPVASEQRDDFAGRHGQRGAADHVGIAVEAVQIAQLKDGAACQDRPPAPARCVGSCRVLPPR